MSTCFHEEFTFSAEIIVKLHETTPHMAGVVVQVTCKLCGEPVRFQTSDLSDPIRPVLVSSGPTTRPETPGELC